MDLLNVAPSPPGQHRSSRGTDLASKNGSAPEIIVFWFNRAQIPGYYAVTNEPLRLPHSGAALPLVKGKSFHLGHYGPREVH